MLSNLFQLHFFLTLYLSFFYHNKISLHNKYHSVRTLNLGLHLVRVRSGIGAFVLCVLPSVNTHWLRLECTSHKANEVLR